MSVKPVEIKAWMGDGTEYVVRYYKEADFDAKERECERLREWITQAKHLSNCQFWHGHPSSESEPEARRWIDGPCTCGRDAALKEQP